jgi:hypothetical protein
MRARNARFLTLAVAVCISSAVFAQTTPPTSGPVKITLDDAIQMALQHNHNLLAHRTVVLQNQAEEITANLRPNPVLQGDAQFLPIFQPDKFSADYINTTAQPRDTGTAEHLKTSTAACAISHTRSRSISLTATRYLCRKLLTGWL